MCPKVKLFTDVIKLNQLLKLSFPASPISNTSFLVEFREFVIIKQKEISDLHRFYN